MATYPPDGSNPWSTPLRNYIDGQAEGAVEAHETKASGAHKADQIAFVPDFLPGIINPSALAPWWGLNPSVVRKNAVIVAGDSISDGALASTYAQTYPQVLQASLRSIAGVTGGIGYVPATPSTGGAITPAIPNTRSGSEQMWSHGLGGRAMYLGASDSHVTYDTLPCTKVRVRYGRTSVAGGAIKVSIDGVDQGVTLVCSGSVNSSGHVWESPELGLGSHTVRITPFNPPFVGIVEGVDFFNGDANAGITVYNGGHSGGTAAQYNLPNMALHWQAVASLNPSLCIIALGTNDIASSDPATFLGGIDDLIAKCPPGVPVLLLGLYLRGDYAGDPEWGEMQAGLESRAVGRVAYFNFEPYWPTLASDGSTSAGLMGDVPPIHPNNAGMAKIAEILTALIGYSEDKSHDLAPVTVPDGALMATNVQGALEEIVGLIENGGGGGGGGPVAASAVTVTPVGGIAATNAQAALAELDSEKLTRSRSLTGAASAVYESTTLDYAPQVADPNIAETKARHFSTGALRLVSWWNEQNLFRFTRNTSWGDSGVRAIRENGDGTNAGNCIELEDRRTSAPASKMFAVGWDGGILQNDIPVGLVYYHTDPEAPLPTNLRAGTLIVMPTGGGGVG